MPAKTSLGVSILNLGSLGHGYWIFKSRAIGPLCLWAFDLWVSGHWTSRFLGPLSSGSPAPTVYCLFVRTYVHVCPCMCLTLALSLA